MARAYIGATSGSKEIRGVYIGAGADSPKTIRSIWRGNGPGKAPTCLWRRNLISFKYTGEIATDWCENVNIHQTEDGGYYITNKENYDDSGNEQNWQFALSYSGNSQDILTLLDAHAEGSFPEVEIFAVGGGGSGGKAYYSTPTTTLTTATTNVNMYIANAYGGNGGAGGASSTTTVTLSSSQYIISIGRGGSASSNRNSSATTMFDINNTAIISAAGGANATQITTGTFLEGVYVSDSTNGVVVKDSSGNATGEAINFMPSGISLHDEMMGTNDSFGRGATYCYNSYDKYYKTYPIWGKPGILPFSEKDDTLTQQYLFGCGGGGGIVQVPSYNTTNNNLQDILTIGTKKITTNKVASIDVVNAIVATSNNANTYYGAISSGLSLIPTSYVANIYSTGGTGLGNKISDENTPKINSGSGGGGGSVIVDGTTTTSANFISVISPTDGANGILIIRNKRTIKNSAPTYYAISTQQYPSWTFDEYRYKPATSKTSISIGSTTFTGYVNQQIFSNTGINGKNGFTVTCCAFANGVYNTTSRVPYKSFDGISTGGGGWCSANTGGKWLIGLTMPSKNISKLTWSEYGNGGSARKFYSNCTINFYSGSSLRSQGFTGIKSSVASSTTQTITINLLSGATITSCAAGNADNAIFYLGDDSEIANCDTFTIQANSTVASSTYIDVSEIEVYGKCEKGDNF